MWHSLGCIYPALEPTPKESEAVPLTSVLGSVNAANEPEEPFTDADRVPDTTPYTFTEFKQLVRTGANGRTYHQYRDDFERIVASEDGITAELLSTYKAPALKALAARFGILDAHRNTKQKNASSIHRSMLEYFLLDRFVSYDMSTTYAEAVAKKVRAVTEDDWNAHHERIAKNKAELEESIANPQSLYDFAKFIEAKSVDAMTDEQFALWDRLHAELARDRRSANGPSATVAQIDIEGLQLEIVPGYHSKRECDIWTVTLSQRLGDERFRELKRKAKDICTDSKDAWYYKAFRGTPGGFHFTHEEDAKTFVTLLENDVDRSNILEARKERSEQTAAGRLHDLADALFARAEETIERSNNSLQNTVKRATDQAHVRGNAYADQALSRSLHSIAEALSTGTAIYLDGLRHKTHLEALDGVLYRARRDRIIAIRKAENETEYGYGLRVQEEDEKPYSEQDIRFATYPHPYAYKSWLEKAIDYCGDKKGMKQASSKMAKLMRRTSSERIDFTNEHDIAIYIDFVSRARVVGYETQWLDTGIATYKRIQAAKLDDLHELRAALREYLPHKASTRGDDPVKVAERELIGKDLPGFVPTTRKVTAEHLLPHADIKPHHKFLEPSCGKGDIVIVVRENHPDLDITAIEKNLTLADILAAQGIDAQFGDFLEHHDKYDRIVMNPPFENGQDITHVRHAYSLLLPRGRVTSIVSEGPFFRSDAKATAFREWFEDLGGMSYQLPDDAFKGADAFRQTSVRTRVVVIDRE